MKSRDASTGFPCLSMSPVENLSRVSGLPTDSKIGDRAMAWKRVAKLRSGLTGKNKPRKAILSTKMVSVRKCFFPNSWTWTRFRYFLPLCDHILWGVHQLQHMFGLQPSGQGLVNRYLVQYFLRRVDFVGGIARLTSFIESWYFTNLSEWINQDTLLGTDKFLYIPPERHFWNLLKMIFLFPRKRLKDVCGTRSIWNEEAL